MDIRDERSFLDNPTRLAEALDQALPDVVTGLKECVADPYLIFAQSLFTASENNYAAATVGGQAINDFADLCYELITCRGRPALRVARSLFEHLVNFYDVLSDADSLARYQAHHAVAAHIEAEAEIGIDRLKGGELKSARHLLGKLSRDSQTDYDAALAKYGSSFRAAWASTNLRDRSTKYGLDSEYRFYRLASMVLHGSAGGAKGTLSTSYPKPVQRTGPSLQLCPPAYVKGLVYFRRLAERAESGLPGVSSAALLTALDGALELWPDYRRLLMKWDEGYWPEGIPIGQYAILAVGRGNSRRWYIHDKALQLVIRADPPTPGRLTQKQTQGLDKLIAGLPPGDERSDDWVTITVPDVQLTPRSGAKWVPETVILLPKRERDRRRLKAPKPIDPDSPLGPYRP